MFKNRQLKYLFSAIITAATVSAITSNLKSQSNIAYADSKPKVVVSHNVICDLVQTIAQDTIDLTCLIDANQDPHTYRPTPTQRKAIEEAQLIFYGGYELEPQIVSLFTNKETPKIAIYEQVVTEPIMVEHDEHDEHDESAEKSEAETTNSQAELEPDPHVWHNIENTVAMVESIKSIFLQVNPQAAEQYLINSVTLTEQLWQLDAWIKDQIDTIPEGQKVLVSTHDSLNYYVQAYNLENYLTLQGLNTESSPTASQVRELSTKIKQTGVPTIFVESTKSDRVMQNVARTADVKLSENTLYADGLGRAESYLKMMSHNTCAIVDGLGGDCQPFDASK